MQILSNTEFKALRKATSPRHIDTLGALYDLAASQANDIIDDILTVPAGTYHKLSLKTLERMTGVKAGNSKVLGSCVAHSSLECKRGTKLMKVKGSICSGCYAENLSKMYVESDIAWLRNSIITEYMIEAEPALFAEMTAVAIRKQSANKEKRGVAGSNLHRWFDSGDLQSVQHLDFIKLVAESTPEVRHWLPTRERSMVRNSDVMTPDNLAIRVSDDMVDQRVESDSLSSGVHSKGNHTGFECPAYTRGGTCGDCTACWDKSTVRVSYLKH